MSDASSSTDTNFSFLHSVDSELYTVIRQAETYFSDDPATTLFKLRVFAELVTKRLCSKRNIPVPSFTRQHELLASLQRVGVATEVLHWFHHIRRRGNRASHENHGTHEDALEALKNAWRIGVWYCRQETGNRAFRPPDFASITSSKLLTPRSPQSPEKSRPLPAIPTPQGLREYKLVLHDDFRRTLRQSTLSPDWRRELVDCLRHLTAGQWKGGTRVKKLQGCDDLLEARINKGDRLLFSRASQNRLVIYDAVKHDDVERRYRRITYTPDIENQEPTERLADPLEALLSPAAESPALDPLDVRAVPDPWKTRYSEGTIPRLFAPSDDVWNDPESLLLWSQNSGLDIDLLLTEEQAEVSRLGCAVLLSGSAGSGKTTVVVHSLLQHQIDHPEQKLLYVTYLPQLSRNARDLYLRLSVARGAEGLPVPTFLTYEELCRRLISDAQASLPTGDIFLESHFEPWLQKQKNVPRLSPTALWCEIRGVIKGRSKSWSLARHERLLPLDSYLSLGSAVGSLPNEHRQSVWRLAERYDRHLLENARFDDIDLARAAGNALVSLRSQSPDAYRYDGLFCDEVQDLTALQSALIDLLQCDEHVRLFLAGDEHQTIYPSAFRWGDLNDLLRAKDQPYEVRALGQNFRSSQPVLDLAYTTLMGLKKRLLSPFRKQRALRWTDIEPDTHKGPPGVAPARITVTEDELVGLLTSLPPNAQRIVLTHDRDARDLLLQKLEKARHGAQPSTEGADARPREELVASIDEFKGLEADCVVLWDFFSAERTFWTAAATTTPTESPYDVLTECNRMYVALTRTHRYLALCDPPGATAPWDFDDYDGLRPATQTEAWLVDLQSQASSPEDFLRRGRVLEASRVYRLAMSCYRNGDDVISAARCEAMLAESEDRWQDAGHLWRDACRWDDARRCYQKCGDTYGLLAMDAEEAEDNERYEEAAIAWLRADEPARAGAAYERCADMVRAHDAWKRCGEALLREFECRWTMSALSSLLPRLEDERNGVRELIAAIRQQPTPETSLMR